ncbi:MAG: helix-turn-helix transcriptional regulator, partial [Henriciella sp.]|nr:helix-turn-helix transcriptional regulator [Henriciella sp.]
FNGGRYSRYSHLTCREAREQLGLSNREVELLMWISSGLTKKQIAERMGVTSATVDTFRRRAYAKLGVRTGAAASAILAAFLAGTRVEAVKVGAPA